MTAKPGFVDSDPAGSATLEVLCRGLVGYVSFLAACGGHPVYSEYALYEPILRIGHAQGYKVRCEVPVKKRKKPLTSAHQGGDYPRIDFDFMRSGDKPARFGIEVKWTDKESVGVTKDVEKLKRHAKRFADSTGYVLVFGPHDVIRKLKPMGLGCPIRQSKLIGWSAGKTKYGARWFRVV